MSHRAVDAEGGRQLVFVISALLCLGALPQASDQTRRLTFEERVRTQEAIERVYYSHQIGATRPFEEAVPRGVLEKKVRTYLKQTVALEKYWKTPVTSEMLQRETQRIATNTRFPERLEEVFDALGHDPLRVLECFARPALADRLIRSFFAHDKRIHAQTRLEAEELRSRLQTGSLDPLLEHPRREAFQLVRIKLSGPQRKAFPSRPSAERQTGPPRFLELPGDEFDRWQRRTQTERDRVSAILEEREAFVITVTLAEREDDLDLAIYTIPKLTWDEWWGTAEQEYDEGWVQLMPAPVDPLPLLGRKTARKGPLGLTSGFSALPSGGENVSSVCAADDTWQNGILDALPLERTFHSAVWTGSLMIVWGGLGASGYLQTGARYDPLLDTWAPTSMTAVPMERSGHTAVWTGSLMVVWGGCGPAECPTSTGSRYDPASDTWSSTTTFLAPAGRYFHTAVWSGSHMIVWGGGAGSGPTDTGGRYDPGTDSWSQVSATSAPSARVYHTAAWTGSQMLIWGGSDILLQPYSTGARYDPVSNTWTPMTTANAPTARAKHTAVWTGETMIVWGGGTPPGANLSSGGRYDPQRDTWTTTSTTGSPDGRNAHTAIWTGSVMIIWGGHFSIFDFDEPLDSGARYDPKADTWSPISRVNVPLARGNHTAVWTGSLIVVWGGNYGSTFGRIRTFFNTGGRYDPATDSWTPTSYLGAPVTRRSHSAVWTGNQMIIWGGFGLGVGNTGGRYDPLTDSWSPTSTTDAPTARDSHSSLWTGLRMVVWGGYVGSGPTNHGGQYDPQSDTWRATSTVNAPSARYLHTALWTGSLMVVWGGAGASGPLNDGGRYDPLSDTWERVSTIGSPMPRLRHTAVWTGGEIVVWGGGDGTSVFSDGGRYNSVDDTWAAVSTAGPPARWNHTAVWTGREMIVWGGTVSGPTPTYLNTGGRYDPSSDSWTPTTLANAPSGRFSHTAVWTGSQMVVWGGVQSGGTFPGTGGRYDPAADTWAPTMPVGAPSGLTSHTAVWTGGTMIVWGESRGGQYALGLATDNDGDGLSECQGDCNDTDPLAWSPPAEVRNLMVFTGSCTNIAWDDQSSIAGPGVTFDLVSGLLLPEAVFEWTSVSCLQHTSANILCDERPSPQAGSGYWYLVRARNSCAAGTFGSGERDTNIPPCP